MSVQMSILSENIFQKRIFENILLGTSLVVQWLRFHASITGCTVSIPGQRTKIQYAGINKSIKQITNKDLSLVLIINHDKTRVFFNICFQTHTHKKPKRVNYHQSYTKRNVIGMSSGRKNMTPNGNLDLHKQRMLEIVKMRINIRILSYI